MPMLLTLALPLGVFYFVLSRNNRKQKRERTGFLESLAKNDKVMTVGGIVGTVVTVREKEVVLKVDESTNTKMTFMKTAIQQVMGDGSAA